MSLDPLKVIELLIKCTLDEPLISKDRDRSIIELGIVSKAL